MVFPMHKLKIEIVKQKKGGWFFAIHTPDEKVYVANITWMYPEDAWREAIKQTSEIMKNKGWAF